MRSNSKYLILSIVFVVLGIYTLTLIGASGTVNTLVVRTDANNYLLATAVTQTNPVTQGVFSSRTLRTDANGSLQVILTGTVTPTYPMAIPASTCAAPSLGESGAVTTGIAFTATPSIFECISGTAVNTITSASVTSTIRYLLPAGTAGAPAITLGGNNTVGWYNSTSNLWSFSNGTIPIFVLAPSANIAAFGSGTQFAWSSTTSADGSADLTMFRLSADNLVLGDNDKFNLRASALITTSTDALILVNNTAALVGSTVQISPRARLTGSAWDTDDAVSRTVSYFMENLPATGNTVSGTWKLGYIDPVSSAITYPLTLSSAGVLTTSATTFMHSTSAALANGAAAQVATMTNGPTAGNPTKWIAINDNGTTRYIPAW